MVSRKLSRLVRNRGANKGGSVGMISMKDWRVLLIDDEVMTGFGRAVDGKAPGEIVEQAKLVDQFGVGVARPRRIAPTKLFDGGMKLGGHAAADR